MLLISGEHCHQYILISLKYVVKPNQTDPVIFWGKSKSKGRLQERRSNLRSVESHSTLESALNQFSLQENIVLPSWVYYRSIVTSCIAYHFRDIFAYSNINVIYASLKSTFSGLQLCRWQYDSNFIRLAVVASQICESPRIFDRIAVGLGFHQATLVWCPCSSGNPREFLDKIYPAKTTGGTTVQRKLHDPNFSRFWLIRPCDGQTGDSI